jgi:hypothetical protein
MENNTITENNETLLADMMNRRDKAPEPSIGDKIVNRGDDKVPAPMVFNKVLSAGYTYIYDTKTGDRSRTNNNMLLAQLKKKNKDGTQRFTTVKPPFSPPKPAVKCLLSASNPNRPLYDKMSLPVCEKALINDFQVRRHMMKRHKMEWEAIEQERIKAEKQEDREFQRMMMGKKPEPPPPEPPAPLYVSDKVKKK